MKVAEKSPYVLYDIVNHIPKRTERVPIRCPKCGETHNLLLDTHLKLIKRRNGQYSCANCIDIGIGMSKKWQDPTYRNKMLRVIHESRLHASVRTHYLWTTPEYRQKILAAQTLNREKVNYKKRLFWQDPKHKQEASEKSKQVWERLGHRELQRQISIGLWKDEEYKSLLNEITSSEQFKKSVSEGMVEKWSDVDYRKKIEEHLFKIMTTQHNAPGYGQQVASQMRNLWLDPKYRNNIIQKLRQLWTTPEHRSRMMAIFLSPEFREKMAAARLRQPMTSTQQKILYSLLDDLDIKHYKDTEEQCKIGFWTFDCRIDPQPNIKLEQPLFIEVQGDYWHNLSEAIPKDKSKATYLKTYFPKWDLKYLWEHEFSNKDRVRELVKYWCRLTQPQLKQFQFNEIKQNIIDSKEAEIFISKYHYAGRIGRSGVNLGYFLGDKLIAVMIYSKPVRQEVATKQGFIPKEVLELSRLAIHPEYQIKNLASFILGMGIRYIKQNHGNIKLLVSFCDSTYNHIGTIYKASNWTLDGEVPQDYWYVDKEGYVCHKKTLWNKAVSFKLTESQYCEKYGYKKVWGGKKLRFIYPLKSGEVLQVLDTTAKVS
jgi:hypothetical protein